MINNDYNIELDRLNQIEPVDIPHLENVQMIVKDRIDSHSYEPLVYDHLKDLSDDPHISHNLLELRSGTKPQGVPDIPYPDVQVDIEHSIQLGRRVRYLRIYRKGNATSTQKALVYIHGGAYYGGSAEDTLPFLRLLATKFNGIIYSVDYGLAPENPYPSGIEDCLSVLIEASNNHSQVSIGGDSAGGSMALGVSQLSHAMGLCNIYKHVLFYPTVVHGSDYKGSLWNEHLIPVSDDQRRILHNNYSQFKQIDKIMTEFYTAGKDRDITAPILSPLYADPINFKKVLIMTGEFDPFRLQDEAFVQKVGMAGCDAKYIRYGGLGHA